ncbi:NAD(P)/FAD-dependent oxidoreductase [Chloroflexota bacterium]
MPKPIIDNHEIVIIGGGPAGLSTALHLEKTAPKLAKKIIILEKAEYPRPKLCAGGITVDAEYLLESLALNLNEIPYRLVESVSLLYNGKGLNLNPKNCHPLKVIQRDEFDHWLVEKARERGILIREKSHVKNIHRENDNFIVETNSGTFRCRVVVGADGSNGITRGCLIQNNRLKTARLLEIHEAEIHGALHSNEIATFDFTPIASGISGYTWDFPALVKGVPTRCLGIFDNNLHLGKTRQSLRSALFHFLQEKHFEVGEIQLQGHPLRLFSLSQPLSGPGVLLVGDSAGSDPFFGEGISLALGYGFIAAKTIKKSFNSNIFEFDHYRRDILRSSLGQTLVVRKIIAKILYSIDWHWFQQLVWHILKPVVKLAGWIFVLNWAKRLK